MGSTIIDVDFPYDIRHRGQKDAIRHNKRVKEAVRKQLKDVISQQDIISSEGNKRVRVRLKYLDQYHFRHYPDRYDEVGRDQFEDLEEGELLQKPDQNKRGKGGGQESEDLEEVYEAEFTIDELTDLLIQELHLPDLDQTAKNEIVSDILEYNDRRRRTGIMGCLDKKQTLKAMLLRKAQMKKPKEEVIALKEDDLRFKTWEIAKERHSNAVIVLMMDHSGSMTGNLFAVKSFYFWIVQFLKRKYDRVEIRFIAHDMVAKELTEKEFFTMSDAGGTSISSAYELCKDIIVQSYPQDQWNIYCFHATDGDTSGDEKQCMKLVYEIWKLGCKLFGYAEVRMGAGRDSHSELYQMLKKSVKKAQSRVMVFPIRDNDDILEAINSFLGTHTHVAENI